MVNLMGIVMTVDFNDKKVVKKCNKDLIELNDTLKKSLQENQQSMELEKNLTDITYRLIDIL